MPEPSGRRASSSSITEKRYASLQGDTESQGASLEAERLTAQRGHATLFADVSLAVRGGSALVVTGRNGSGKTTLLRMLAGLTAPVAGEIRWRRSVTRPFDVRLRAAVAFNGHLPALKDELTAEENLAQWVSLGDRPPASAAIRDALAAVALERRRSLPVRLLSQGQRRRIGLARLRLSRRPLWILDEPLTALDDEGVDVLHGLLETHLAGGGICVAASHQPLPIARERQQSLRLDADVSVLAGSAIQ
ncbi:MAG TPA: cytochrome c biogenesis heme-transporting ATPase CcmA [Casimicrobiaceae bacterium]|nr:cytochrome c biogenesis heme-transporting ATPase CcmA [Casimicrobiaceae bacterium]